MENNGKTNALKEIARILGLILIIGGFAVWIK